MTPTSDGVVVLNIQNGVMFSMNPVAANMFEAVIEGQTEDQIVADVSGRFQVEKERVQADFLRPSSRIFSRRDL